MNKKSLLKIILFILFLIPINSYALEGDYIITSKLSNDMVLDIAGGNAVDNANIQLFTRHGGQNQQWKFVYNEAGYYKIQSTKDNNYCLDVNNEPYTIKSNVKLSACSDAETQHFIVEKDNDGYYKISSYDKQYVIDVGGGVAKDRANIQLFTSHDNDNQRFAINKEIEGNKTIEDGIYTISTNNLYMNANSNSIDNRVKINFTTLNNSKNQKWKVTYLNNGTYQISSLMNQNYSLDIPGGKKVANTYIQLFQNNYGINQQWIIKDNGNGTYQIISKSNGLNLEASSEISFVNDENNSENQNFKFEVTTTKEEIIIPDGIYTIIAKAKENNMPNDNIERSIKKASGELSGVNYEAITYEGYGVGGSAVIVECLTDNKNRTAGDVRHAFDKHGGSMGNNGCVSYLFKQKGVVIVVDAKDSEALMLDAIEEGAVDVVEDEDEIEIITEPNEHGKMRDALTAKGYNVVSANTELVPDMYVDLNEEQLGKFERMVEALEDLDDVQEVYHNVNLPEEDE